MALNRSERSRSDEAANRLASDTFYLRSRHNRRLTDNHGAKSACHSGLFDKGFGMRIHHLAVFATVACVPLAACVPAYGSGYGADYAGGGYGYAPGPVAVAPAAVIAGGEYYGGGPYYGYGYRGRYGEDGDRRGEDPGRSSSSGATIRRWSRASSSITRLSLLSSRRITSRYSPGKTPTIRP